MRNVALFTVLLLLLLFMTMLVAPTNPSHLARQKKSAFVLAPIHHRNEEQSSSLSLSSFSSVHHSTTAAPRVFLTRLSAADQKKDDHNSNNHQQQHLDTTTTVSTRTRTTDKLWGGEYAGYQAWCCAKSGKLLDVPSLFVAPEMEEWGQIPQVVELLVSENEKDCQRTGWQVIPDCGCAVDNLSLYKQHEDELYPMQMQTLESFETLDRVLPNSNFPNKPLQVYTETIFPWESDNDDDDSPRRVRVVVPVRVDPKDGTISGATTLCIMMERRLSHDPNHFFSDLDSGGLDALTVSRWIGTVPVPKNNLDSYPPAKTTAPAAAVPLPGHFWIQWDTHEMTLFAEDNKGTTMVRRNFAQKGDGPFMPPKVTATTTTTGISETLQAYKKQS